ncbi:hypothetical protein HPB47_020106 [Ixodes persulcatus]|uniref:Uncharacterized protein n=1 Tax=Ixodes persulcatus TaxID=34615 RepID=A0AC60QJV8_IXOPE|nr:hypothetical protein HPB47_020106 [Ixodes persulcatus]
MRDRERGRREVVILYRGQDSESVHSDSTEEGEIKSPLKGSMLSTVGASFVSRVEKTKAELEDTMDLASDASCAETEQPVKVTAEDPPKLAKGSKKASASSHKVATKHTELVKEEPARKKDVITSRTGGAYIPPARLRMMQEQITDKSSMAYQRIAWEALKKSINGLVNKANTGNIKIIIEELLHENIVRGRGVLCRTIMTAQAASPTFTHVYAAIISVINTKFPQTGEMILKRLVIQFRRAFQRNDKNSCMASVRFIAHLLNQQVAHEVLALELLTLLLGNPTDDSVEVAIAFLKECGMKLTELTPKGIHAIFERLRSILHEVNLEKRVQYMIEVIFAIRKDGFSAHPSVLKELDLVSEEEQYTHLLALDDPMDGEDGLNVFKFDPEYLENEERYKEISRDIVPSDEEGEGSGSEGSDEEEDDDEVQDENGEIIDNTETNLVALRRTIYLTIQSSLNFEECAHKLLKLELKPGQLDELCHMVLDCCAQQRTYEKFFGLLAQRFCQLKKEYAEPFEQIFLSSYDTIHRFETNKLRNVAKFFAHLLFTDAIPWSVSIQRE